MIFRAGRKESMQIRKTYGAVSSKLLYDELRDFALKQGMVLDEAKLETYSVPEDSSTFISRGTLTFRIQDGSGKTDKESLRIHIVGSASGETKVMIDVNEELFPPQKVSALQEDIDFVFGSYEVKAPAEK